MLGVPKTSSMSFCFSPFASISSFSTSTAACFERVMFFFEVFDQQSQEIGHAAFGSRNPITFAVEFFQHGDVTLVLRLAANDGRQSARKESGILRSDCGRTHNFQPLV
jgi:hypothetical protein